MKKELFYNFIANSAEVYLPKYAGNGFRIKKIERSDGDSYTGLIVQGGTMENMTPCVDLDFIYENIWEDFAESIFGKIAEVLEITPLDSVREMALNISNFNNVKDKIFFRLGNYEKSPEVVKNSVNKRVYDLILSCHILVGESDEGAHMTVVSKELANEWGVSEEEIFALAKENTPKLFPAKFMGMNDMLFSMVDCEVPELPGMPKTYIVTNEKCIYGAASIFYSGLLQEIAEKLNSSFYILPSSVHEIILIPAERSTYSDMSFKEMVQEANDVVVSEAEFLSNNIYYYDRTLEAMNKI